MENIKPDYYGQGTDVIDFIYSELPDTADAFMVGNIVKYVIRFPHKNGLEDLIKARTYLDRLIDKVSDRKIDDAMSEVDRMKAKTEADYQRYMKELAEFLGGDED